MQAAVIKHCYLQAALIKHCYLQAAMIKHCYLQVAVIKHIFHEARSNINAYVREMFASAFKISSTKRVA